MELIATAWCYDQNNDLIDTNAKCSVSENGINQQKISLRTIKP